MGQDIRFQPKCYYASDKYANSFIGRYVYLYQGQASLRLTEDALILQGGRNLTIPLKCIKRIGLRRFSLIAKPFGLEALVVQYSIDDWESETIHLIPFESALTPTPITSQLVEDWFATLGQVKALAGRIEPPTFEPIKSSSGFRKVGGLAAAIAILVSVGAFLMFLIIGR
jgi:hypothetical protein